MIKSLNGSSGTISGINLDSAKVKDTVSNEQLNNVLKNNNLDEIVVENDKGKFILFADQLRVKGKSGLPSVGETINFGDFNGKVVVSNNDINSNKDTTNQKNDIKTLCVKSSLELEKESKLPLAEKIANAEKESQANTNTLSIYGQQVSLEDAQSWLDNNPILSQSPKLLKLADFKTIDGKIDAQELSKISSGGAVVLNGPNSFYLPGEKVAEVPNNKKLTEQEKYYQRKNNEANAKLASSVADGILSILLK